MMFDCSCPVSLADTPVVLVQLVENPPWIKRDSGEFIHRYYNSVQIHVCTFVVVCSCNTT